MDEFLIGDVLFRWTCKDYTLEPGEFMDRFRHSGEWNGDVVYLGGHVESLNPYLKYPCLERNRVYDRYDVDGEPLLIYHWGHLRNGFAVWPRRVGITSDMSMFDPKLSTQRPVHADWFFGISGIHALLLQRGALILHSSYVEYEGKALLFTAPSGTGKSTQAELWKEYAGAAIINGDRVLLRPRNGIWYAHGFPCCGSSNICENRTLPIAAIVVLEQGTDNTVSFLSDVQKIRTLASGTEVYLWDLVQIDQAIRLSGQISEHVPVVKLSCTPDKNAVSVLQQFLEEYGYGTSI